jgi:very-short-patch-repair endonuclease
MSDSTTEQARQRIRQLFRFLQAFNEKKNPVPTRIAEQPRLLWWRELPSHPNLQRALFDDAPITDEPGGGAALGTPAQADFVLKVRRVDLGPPPLPPDTLLGWILEGWEDPRREPQQIASRPRSDSDSELELFESHGDRPVEFDRWLAAWRAWAVTAIAAYEVNLVFNVLFDIRADMEREAERHELVLGDGLLNWYRPSGGIHFPVLLQRLQLEYDPSIPEFTLAESDRPAELNASLLRHARVDGAVVAGLIAETQRLLVSPLGAERTTDFLRTLAASIAPNGQYVADGAPEGEEDFPRLGRDPVIFLRSRAQGFEAAISNILEDIEDCDHFPESLVSICGIHAPQQHTDPDPQTWVQADEVSDVLLSKEANREQLEIARRLARYGAVRVQGPPGTGKTHTIANLVGHLLADGKSVLVTSHTTKALGVLREKIAADLQPLCVSVLEGDAMSRAQLSDSVTRIGARLASGSPDQLLREAAALRQQRKSLLDVLQTQRARLLAAVSAEYAEVVVNGRTFTTEQAATLVAEGVGQHDWIPGPVPGELPLSPVEVDALYATNLRVTAEEEDWIDERLPSFDHLLSPGAFQAAVDRLKQIQEAPDIAYRADAWTECFRSVGDLQALASSTRSAVASLRDAPVWYFAALAAGAAGGAEERPWKDLAAMLKDAASTARDRRLAEMQFDPRLAQGLSASDAVGTIAEIREHVANGGALGWWVRKLHGHWRKVLDDSSCLGAPPWTVESLDALATLPRASAVWDGVARRWPLHMAQHGAKLPGGEDRADEIECHRTALAIEEALDLPAQRIRPMAARANELGLDWAEVAAESQLPAPNAQDWRSLCETLALELPRIFESESLRLERTDLLRELKDLAAVLDASPTARRPESPVASLLAAVNFRDAVGYAAAHRGLADIINRSDALATRRNYLGRLSAVTLNWAEAIRLRLPPNDGGRPPGDPRRAWEWRTVCDELEQRCVEQIDGLIAAIEATKNDLRQTTTELIDRLAWANQMKRTEPAARQALQLWLATVKKIGKGSGKNVPVLRRAAQEHMAAAQEAVPVWIAPLSRVAESFDAKKSHFDVVIIDEASQCDVMGLIALYLGTQVVVVGDDQQVTPAAVGDRIDTANQLINAFLQGIPGKELYDGQYSIYEIAGTAFAGVTQLREHFRCVPDIIRFSNALSYDWKIVPLRDASSARVGPPVVALRVEDGSSDNKRNRQEARYIASLILAADEQPEYADLTFGVISLLGSDQARDIEILLRNNMPLAQYERRRVLCGTPPQFQGDERDVVFLSMVDGPPENPPLNLRGDPGELWKKRYNVAASRARDQLWVVYSLDPLRDLKPADLRWRLIEFARDPLALQSQVAQAQARAESPLETGVIRRLVTEGYRVTPQVEVGGYRIDLVVGDDRLKLAVECDGDRYHTPDNLQQDLDRQAQLERLGWRFVRIRGSEYFRDAEAALKPLFKRLSDLGIEPGGAWATSSPATDSAAEELLERVRRRGAEIRESWGSQSPNGEMSSGRRPRWAPGPAAASPASASSKESSEPRSARTTAGIDRPSSTLLDEPVADSAQLPAQAIWPLPGMESDAPELPGDKATTSDLIRQFRSQGFEVDDKRPNGGALWVYDPSRKLDTLMRTLRSGGFLFQYSSKRAGWYLK